MRLTSRAGTKVGHSDPVVPHGRAIAQRIKGTPGITGRNVYVDVEIDLSLPEFSNLNTCKRSIKKNRK